MPIDLGIGFDELDRLSRPPLFPDGTYEFVIDKVEDSPVKESGRPQWKLTLKPVNRPDLESDSQFKGRGVFLYAQLPWIDPDTKQWDYSNTFTLVNLIKGTGMQVAGTQMPDKEAFVGRTGVMKLGHRTRKGTENDPEPTIDQQVSIVVKRGGGGVVA